jgi:YfiH family protein
MGNLLDINCREQLRKKLNLPNEPVWLEQQHKNKIICANKIKHQPEADASYATLPNVICTVLTADCLPILLCDRLGTKVAAIHAGWRSLASGIIENTIKRMQLVQKFMKNFCCMVLMLRWLLKI